jgi:hypothetical protein
LAVPGELTQKIARLKGLGPGTAAPTAAGTAPNRCVTSGVIVTGLKFTRLDVVIVIWLKRRRRLIPGKVITLGIDVRLVRSLAARLFLDDRYRWQLLALWHRIHVHDHATALAVLTGLTERLQKPGTDALTRHLHEAQRGDLGDLMLGPVPAQALGQPA